MNVIVWLIGEHGLHLGDHILSYSLRSESKARTGWWALGFGCAEPLVSDINSSNSECVADEVLHVVCRVP